MQDKDLNLSVVPMSKEHVNDVAALHYKILGWSLSCRLGKSIIDELYSLLVGSEEFFGFVCYYENTLIGFASATLDHEKTRKRVSKVYQGKLPQVVFNALTHPEDFIILFESAFIIPRILEKQQTKAEWLNLVTDIENPELYPRAAYLLRENIRETFLAKGINMYIGQVYANKEKIRKYHAKHKNSTVIKRLFSNDLYLFDARIKIDS